MSFRSVVMSSRHQTYTEADVKNTSKPREYRSSATTGGAITDIRGGTGLEGRPTAQEAFNYGSQVKEFVRVGGKR